MGSARNHRWLPEDLGQQRAVPGGGPPPSPRQRQPQPEGAVEVPAGPDRVGGVRQPGQQVPPRPARPAVAAPRPSPARVFTGQRGLLGQHERPLSPYGREKPGLAATKAVSTRSGSGATCASSTASASAGIDASRCSRTSIQCISMRSASRSCRRRRGAAPGHRHRLRAAQHVAQVVGELAQHVLDRGGRVPGSELGDPGQRVGVRPRRAGPAVPGDPEPGSLTAAAPAGPGRRGRPRRRCPTAW